MHFDVFADAGKTEYYGACWASAAPEGTPGASGPSLVAQLVFWSSFFLILAVLGRAAHTFAQKPPGMDEEYYEEPERAPYVAA